MFLCICVDIRNNNNKIIDISFEKFDELIFIKQTKSLKKILKFTKRKKQLNLKILHVNNYNKLQINHDIEEFKYKKVLYVAIIGKLEYVNEKITTNVNIGEIIFTYGICEFDKLQDFRYVFMTSVFREDLIYDIKATIGQKSLLKHINGNVQNYNNLFVLNEEIDIDDIILCLNELAINKDFDVDSEEYRDKNFDRKIESYLSYFDHFYLYEKEHIINYFNDCTKDNKIKYQFIFNICNMPSKHKTKMIFKMTENYKVHKEQYQNITLSKNSSTLLTYLKNICDNKFGCIKCQRQKYYFEYCIFCCTDFKKYMDDILNTIKNLCDFNNENTLNELSTLEHFYAQEIYTLNCFLQDYNENIFKITEKHILKFKQYENKIKDAGVYTYLNNTISEIDKANFFITNKYYELFNTPNNFDYECDDFKYTSEQYINSFIKHQHSKAIMSLVKNVTKYIKYDNMNNLSKIKNNTNGIEAKFLYTIMDNKSIFRYVKQILIEPVIFHKKRCDCFLFLKIKDNNVPIYIEFDDYKNNVTLVGGHNEVNRKTSDIIKDMYCWFFGFSLIRVKYNENIMDILTNMINNINTFPYYRFYDKYFDKKMKRIEFV